MKTLQRLKLTQLSSSELKEREMGMLKGGATDDCCGCAHGTVNRNANSSYGYGSSIGGGASECYNWTYEGGEWKPGSGGDASNCN